MVNFSHTDPGTREVQWQDAGITKLNEIDLALSLRPKGKLVVVAAHPDDETLGAGGLIHTVLTSSVRVHIVLCSAGEASHPSSPTHSPRLLEKIRLVEFSTALEGLAKNTRSGLLTWEFLGLPDGKLLRHLAKIEKALHDACTDATALAAPFRADGHTDHEALGDLCATLAATHNIDLFEYPIWYWHWADPILENRWSSWHSLPLDAAARAAKQTAMLCHWSQVSALSDEPGDEVLLPERFLQHFQRNQEVFAWTPNTAGSATNATERFDALYRRSPDPWDTVESSYEADKRAATLSALGKNWYEHALEIGCSIGTFTRPLAARCRALSAVDASTVAVSMAQDQLADLPNVKVRHAVLPSDWSFAPNSLDLIVFSEVGYFLTPDELTKVLADAEKSLKPGGELLMCHWLHPVNGWPMDGSEVHALARRLFTGTMTTSRQETDYILEVFTTPDPSHG